MKTTGPYMEQEESYENTTNVDTTKLLYNTGELRGACTGTIIDGIHHNISVPITDPGGQPSGPYEMYSVTNLNISRPDFKAVVTPTEE